MRLTGSDSGRNERQNSGAIGHDTEGSASALVRSPAFQPGVIWKLMGFFWKYPSWHSAVGRDTKGGWVIRHKKVDADEPESVLADRTLAAIRDLLSFITNCAALYRTPGASRMGGYSTLSFAVQTVLGTNKKSLALHDRVSLITSLSSQVENNCVICSMFNAFRYFVSTGILDDECGTPNDWDVSLLEGGNTALLTLLRRFESIGAADGVDVVQSADLRRFPAFITALMNVAGQPAAGYAVSESAPTQPEVAKEFEKLLHSLKTEAGIWRIRFSV